MEQVSKKRDLSATVVLHSLGPAIQAGEKLLLCGRVSPGRKAAQRLLPLGIARWFLLLIIEITNCQDDDNFDLCPASAPDGKYVTCLIGAPRVV